MDAERARSLQATERLEVERLLLDLNTARSEDRSAERENGASGDPAQPLSAQGVDDAVAAGLRERLAALDRAVQRIADGTYGRSVRSGELIPDERLEADPAAELTIEEASAHS